MDKIVILGATGGCLDVLNTINQINERAGHVVYRVEGFLDDQEVLQDKVISGVKVIGSFYRAKQLLREGCLFATAIGSEKNYFNKKFLVENLGIPANAFATIIHPSAIISKSVEIGYGCVIHQNVVISSCCKLGNFVLILPNSVINHDSVVGEYSIINTLVSISGDVNIGNSCYISTGVSIKQKVIIGDMSLVGMGSVVIKNVTDKSIVFGNPAKFIRYIEG